MNRNSLDSIVIADLTGQPIDQVLASPHVRDIGTLFIMDSLTGLYNRRYLQRRMTIEMEAAAGLDRPMATLLLDLDGFKGVNDQLGHAVGDQVLVSAARCITRHVPVGGVAARYGGDEFVLFAPGYGADEALDLARRLLDDLHAIAAQIGRDDLPPLGGSIGIAVWPTDGEDQAELLAAADQAMYHAKRYHLGAIYCKEIPAEEVPLHHGGRDELPARFRRVRGQAAIVLAQLAGVGVIRQSDPVTHKTMVGRYDELFRGWMRRYGGTLLAQERDESTWCAIFPHAWMAVEAALELSLRLTAEPPCGTEPIRARMAIHWGEVSFRKGRYRGLGIFWADQLLALAPSQNILLSGAIVAFENLKVPYGARVEAMGTHRLPDLLHEESIFRLEHPTLPAGPDRLASLSTIPNNLPVLSSRFVGREREIAQMRDRMSNHRLVTIVGGGGMGKTRLALQLAARSQHWGEDGIWFCDLAPLTSGEQVIPLIATTLGLERVGGKEVAVQIEAKLGNSRCVLVLDNCEHLASAPALLALQLLPACPNLRIVVTSRRPLRAPGEVIFRLGPLTGTAGQMPTSLEGIWDSEAVRLFMDRAQMSRHGFTLTENNGPDIIRLCRQLDGIPLAVELAAAQLGVWDVGQIRFHLERHFEGVHLGERAPRQRTLSETLEWSWGLLGPHEQRLLRRLAVFAGTFSWDQVGAICTDDGLVSSDLSMLLPSLVEQSLLTEQETGDRVRYRLLEVVRQFIERKLVQSGEAKWLRSRHLNWCVSFARQGDEGIRGSDVARWADRMALEHENTRAALLFAERTSDHWNAGLELASSLVSFWKLRGRSREGRQHLIRLLSRAGKQSPHSGRGYLGLGVLAFFHGDFAETLAAFDDALTIYRQHGDLDGQSIVLKYIGAVCTRLGDYHRAQASGEEALMMARQLGNRSEEARILGNLGILAVDRCDYDRAQTLLDESLALTVAHQLIGGRPIGLIGSANLHLCLGRYGEAERCAQESLRLLREMGERNHSGDALILLALIARDTEDFAKAQGYAEEALRIAEEEMLGPLQFHAIRTLGTIALHLGETHRAVDSLTAAANLAGSSQWPSGHADALVQLGHALYAAGDLVGSEAAYRRSVEIWLQLNGPLGVMECLEGLAQISAAGERWQEASHLLAAAELLRNRLGVPIPPVAASAAERLRVSVRSNQPPTVRETPPFSNGTIDELRSLVSWANRR